MLDIAILDGARTPFAKAFGALASVPAQELGRIATRAALARANIAAEEVDQVVFGNVAPPADAPNVARVIALQTGIPRIPSCCEATIAPSGGLGNDKSRIAHIADGRTGQSTASAPMTSSSL